MWQQLWLIKTKRGAKAVKLGWLLPSLLGVFLLTSPAEAARLKFWRFDTNQNQLDFTTDEGVQPRAQLIANPTRLVIDLPGIVLGRPAMSQSVGQSIRTVRVGQFDAQTTRIVIELAPGYTLDPQQVKVRGISPTSWSVTVPNPQLIPQSADNVQSLGNSPNVGNSGAIGQSPVAGLGARTQIEDLRITPDGFFIATRGNTPEVGVKRSRDNKQINIDLKGTTFSSRFKQQDFLLNRHGINQLEVIQVSAAPPIARITLNVNKSSPDWQASASSFGGVVLLPRGGAAAIRNGNPPQASASLLSGSTFEQGSNPSQLATIQGIDLGGNQLLIRADKRLIYTTGWDGAAYRITIRSAQLARQIKGPRLANGSPLIAIRLRQDDPQTVTILATPASGIRVSGVTRPNVQSLVLQFLRSDTAIAVSPPPSPRIIAPTNPLPQMPLPRTVGRRVIVIDPGHGGPDPGAVGIGGLQEKDIVLDIGLKVSQILQQQGVQVYLTRKDDIPDVDLPPRVALAQRVNADAFVSIHANSINLSRQDISGLEIYYAPGHSDRLAQTLHNSILQSLNVRDRGVRSARFYVIRNTTMPSALVEVGFVTGAEDAANLSNPAWRSQMAAAIAQGILQFLQSGR
jgi:N-acetylmuramoyl-L-alanine amidase